MCVCVCVSVSLCLCVCVRVRVRMRACVLDLRPGDMNELTDPRCGYCQHCGDIKHVPTMYKAIFPLTSHSVMTRTDFTIVPTMYVLCVLCDFVGTHVNSCHFLITDTVWTMIHSDKQKGKISLPSMF